MRWELDCASPKALLSLSTLPSATLWGPPGNFSDRRKQNKTAMATLDISPFCLDLPPQPTWASILAATFPLKCRMKELGVTAGCRQHGPLLFSASLVSSLLPPLQTPSSRRFSPSVRSCSLKLYFASLLVTVYKCIQNVTKLNFQYTKGKNEV